MERPLDYRPRPLHFAALQPKNGDWVITATNRTGHDALARSVDGV